MATALRLAFTADLHWGSRQRGDEATRLLAAFLREHPPDVLVLAGDIGPAKRFAECLGLFQDLPAHKALVPGNHDIWVEAEDARGDSLRVYQEYLPGHTARFGFHYLDQGPLFLPGADLALVGSINWYDYSWSIDMLKGMLPDWESRLRTKLFSRGRHNDARFVRWKLDDVRFTAEVVQTLEKHLETALSRAGQVIVVTHHPGFQGLGVPRLGPPSADRLLWEAFSGNRRMEEVLTRHAERVPFTFCGHTHYAREGSLGTVRGYNIGGDYHFKRLVLLDWPEGRVEAHTFGDPARLRG
jgi:predicted phosphohydrolase